MGDTFEMDGDFRNSEVYVNSSVYRLEPKVVSAEQLHSANSRLEELPLNHIPDVSALPPSSRMPLAHNPIFVGRTADLQSLATILKGGASAAVGQVAAVTGMGGIGKTQLAVEFVHLFGTYFTGGCFWLNFADSDSIPAEIAASGGAGGLNLRPDFHHLPIIEQTSLVKAEWSSPLPRLLVFDNCEDEKLFAQWRPQTGACRVLATSRRPQWGLTLGITPLTLGVLSRTESVSLLRKHRPDLNENDAYLEAIAETLGDLPLALHLAGSFLGKYRHADFSQPQAYLAALHRSDLLDHDSMRSGGLSPTGHEQHVGRTFELSTERLDPENPIDALARSLLERAACFAPGEPIPRALLILTVQDIEGLTPQRIEDALTRLIDLGLLNPEDHGALHIHRLVCSFVKVQAWDYDTAQKAVEKALGLEATRLNDVGLPAPLLAWQVHLRHVTNIAADRGIEPGVYLLNSLGLHLNMIADFRNSYEVFNRAYIIAKEIYSSNGLVIARSLNNLGAVLLKLDRLTEAHEAFQKALDITRTTHGKIHPEVAISINNIGSVFMHLNDPFNARSRFRRALKINEEYYKQRKLDERQPAIAKDLSNLCAAECALGNFDSAYDAIMRALEIDNHCYEPGHINIGKCLNNLSNVLYHLGDVEGACSNLKKALSIFEEHLNAQHPSIHTAIYNLTKMKCPS